jgi:hypothetical protein
MFAAALAILRGLSWQVYAGVALVAALGFSHHWAYSKGEASVQRDWDAAKVEAQAAQQAADEAARLKSHAAELSYENQKAAQLVRVVTITREVSHAIDAAPDWSAAAVPAGVRDAIAAAGASLAASEPDRAVPVSAAGSGNERGSGPGLRVGPARPGGLLGAAP